MTVYVNFLAGSLHSELEQMRREAVGSWPGYESLAGAWPPELHQLSNSFVPPGSLWECPWFFDPLDPGDAASLEERIANASQPGYNGILSEHYLRDHARTRPPLCVKLPNHWDWMMDQTSSNGTGWIVTTAGPPYEDVTASPSIVAPGYHGFLQNGQFTPDLDNGQGPHGVPYWLVNGDK